MPLQASRTVAVPPVSIPTFVFESPTAALADEPLILDPARPDDRFLSLASYRRWSQCLAQGMLERASLRQGDRVLFIAGNSIAWPVVFMGSLMAGAIFTGVSPALPHDAMLRLARGLEPTLIFASADGLQHGHAAADDLGIAQDHVFLFDCEVLFTKTQAGGPTAPSSRSWADLLHAEGADHFDWNAHVASSDQLAAINYTSGSTGFSKGVMVTHANVVANAVQYMAQQSDDPNSPEKGIPNTWVMWSPFYHVVGLNQYCVIAPKRGIKNYIMEKLDLRQLLMYTEKYKPLHMFLLPTLLITMLSQPELMSKHDLGSVLTVSAGGAPLRRSAIERFEALMPNPNCRVIQGWGMTEITCIVVNRNPHDRSPSSCVGELLPNVEAIVMAPDGVTEITRAHSPGELWIRSPNVTKGYWRDPERTAHAFRKDGWLRTGDFGYFDDQSRVYVSDRIQDLIYPPATSQGTFVLPTDLEMALLDIPGVVDVGVTGVPLPEANVAIQENAAGLNNVAPARSVPRAFIVVDKEAGVALDDIAAEFADRVKPHERLAGGLYAVAQVPKLPTGKVNRVALRALSV